MNTTLGRTLQTAHLKTKGFLRDVLGSQRHPALAGIRNAEHDPQLQLPHEVVAAVPLEDVLPRLGHVWVSLLLLQPPGPVLLDGLPVLVLVSHSQDGLVRHHPVVVVPQEDDVGSIVVCAGWLVHLRAERLHIQETQRPESAQTDRQTDRQTCCRDPHAAVTHMMPM